MGHRRPYDQGTVRRIARILFQIIALLIVGALTVVALAMAGMHDDPDTSGSNTGSAGMHDPLARKSIIPDEARSGPCFNSRPPGDRGITASLVIGTDRIEPRSITTAESGGTARETDPLLTRGPGSVGMLLSEGLWGSDLAPIICPNRLRSRVGIARESGHETTITGTRRTAPSVPGARSVDRADPLVSMISIRGPHRSRSVCDKETGDRL
jgi:hypothetical protein